MMATAPLLPNYHVVLWGDPDPAYLCLQCDAAHGLTLDAILTHLQDIHQAEPCPTLMAAKPDLLRPLGPERTMTDAATYRTEALAEDQTKYYCLLCEGAGFE